ncbi:MAG: hypothetical protein ACRET0_02755 [Steroidobacteraceae bacterium]
MSIVERGMPVPEINAYRGQGTRGWRVESDETHQDCVVIDAGSPFGGEWPRRQVWEIVDGQGRLSCHAASPYVHARAGDGYRFEAGERRLIMAETTMRIRITPLE